MIESMPKPLPPHVHIERTRHGRLVCYFRKGQGARTRLPLMDSPDFAEAYAKCLVAVPRRKVAESSGSLAWLIARYKESAHWATLKPSTRRMRDNILKIVVDSSGKVPFDAITRKHINEGIDRRPRHAGNTFRKVMSQLFRWAVSMEMVGTNPVEGANRNAIKSDGFHTWSVAEVERFCERWPLGTRERLAMDIMLYTGLRRSDVFRLGRQHVARGLLSIKTEKTGEMVHLPMFSALKRSIEAAPTGDIVFLITQHGRPFTSAASFGNWFGKACRAAKVPGRAHGLRKAGATIAADSGATAHELMAMFGWRQMAQAETYTRDADRKRLAVAPAEHIANAFLPHPQPLLPAPDALTSNLKEIKK